MQGMECSPAQLMFHLQTRSTLSVRAELLKPKVTKPKRSCHRSEACPTAAQWSSTNLIRCIENPSGKLVLSRNIIWPLVDISSKQTMGLNSGETQYTSNLSTKRLHNKIQYLRIVQNLMLLNCPHLRNPIPYPPSHLLSNWVISQGQNVPQGNHPTLKTMSRNN